MAKLKGPLFSLGASQQLGKALVYFGWKGLDVVREYVVPSNPRTAGQTTQRGYMTTAVALVHTCQGRATNAMTATDVSAYALLASVIKSATTWFNQAVKIIVDCLVAGNDGTIFYDGSATAGANQVTVEWYCHYTPPDNATVFWGTSKTALVNSQACNVAGAHFDQVIAGLTTGTKYYFQLRSDVGEGCEGSVSGIYYATPT